MEKNKKMERRRSAESVESLKEKILSPTAAISPGVRRSYVDGLVHFLARVGATAVAPDRKDFYTELITGRLKTLKVEPGSLSCVLTVTPSILNYFATMHGGAVAAIAEAVSIACTRTVFPEDKEIFLGELSISYLSGAMENAEVAIDAKVVRKGRNVTIVGVDFRLKQTQQLVYQTRATFYIMSASKL